VRHPVRAAQDGSHPAPPDPQGPYRPVHRVRLQAQVVDNADGIVLDHTIEEGNRLTRYRWNRRSAASTSARAGFT
jgi:hypothetical protein